MKINKVNQLYKNKILFKKENGAEKNAPSKEKNNSSKNKGVRIAIGATCLAIVYGLYITFIRKRPKE